MAKAIHSMIRVLDGDRSVAFYREAFGLTHVERIDFQTFSLIYLWSDETPFELELTVNNDRIEPYDLGDGYGHLAFTVDDLEAEHARFEAAGFAPRKIVDFVHDGRPLARFFFVQDPDGYQIEVLQQAGRFK